MKKNTKQKGFTLLELLLVVGIAAILIVAGITTYSLVSKKNSVTETVRLMNIILQQTRSLYAGQNSYGVGTGIEAALITTGSIPQKYVNGSDINSPYSNAAGAVVITGISDGTFSVDMQVPKNSTAEIASNFDPNASNEITSVTICGTTIADGTAMPTSAANAVTCTSTATLAAFTIISR